MSQSANVYFFGDIGLLNDNLIKLTQEVEKKIANNDKIVLLGDNFYPNGVKSVADEQWFAYCEIFKKFGYKNIYGILGNHDYMGNPKSQMISPYMVMHDFYYTKRISIKTQLFFIDTVLLYPYHCDINEIDYIRIHNNDYDVLIDKQIRWLDNELYKSDAINKIVIGHYPIITNGYYYNNMKPLYNLLMPIFQKYKIKAYISGHEHNIQFIERRMHYGYNFYQIIIGDSSFNRVAYISNTKNRLYDMYYANDNHFLHMKENDNHLKFSFCNNKGEINYSYQI